MCKYNRTISHKDKWKEIGGKNWELRKKDFDLKSILKMLKYINEGILLDDKFKNKKNLNLNENDNSDDEENDNNNLGKYNFAYFIFIFVKFCFNFVNFVNFV